MRILCPAGNVLHTDAAIAVAIDFIPVLKDSIELIEDKQIRVSSDADYIVPASDWDNWSYSLALANRLILRIANLPTLDKVPFEKAIDKLSSLLGPEVVGLFTTDLNGLPGLLEIIHSNYDAAFQTSLLGDIKAASKQDALVLGSSREKLIKEGLYTEDYDLFFTIAPKQSLRVALKDQPGKFFDLYLPHNEEQSNAFFEIVNNSEIQLPVYADEEIADFVADSDTLIKWFNDVFSFYRLKLKIETYREIKFIEKDNEDFASKVDLFDSIIQETGNENEAGSDTNYFLLNKISGVLNAYGYEQDILHAVTDIDDFSRSDDDLGYFFNLI